MIVSEELEFCARPSCAGIGHQRLPLREPQLLIHSVAVYYGDDRVIHAPVVRVRVHRRRQLTDLRRHVAGAAAVLFRGELSSAVTAEMVPESFRGCHEWR